MVAAARLHPGCRFVVLAPNRSQALLHFPPGFWLGRLEVLELRPSKRPGAWGFLQGLVRRFTAGGGAGGAHSILAERLELERRFLESIASDRSLADRYGNLVMTDFGALTLRPLHAALREMAEKHSSRENGVSVAVPFSGSPESPNVFIGTWFVKREHAGEAAEFAWHLLREIGREKPPREGQDTPESVKTPWTARLRCEGGRLLESAAAASLLRRCSVASGGKDEDNAVHHEGITVHLLPCSMWFTHADGAGNCKARRDGETRLLHFGTSAEARHAIGLAAWTMKETASGVPAVRTVVHHVLQNPGLFDNGVQDVFSTVSRAIDAAGTPESLNTSTPSRETQSNPKAVEDILLEALPLKGVAMIGHPDEN
uniref:Uncharacterized protein n=1 Tax=Tetraselmis sp. GSL018 TaxID=582737 RepID=A0A061SE50_9CHLO